MSFRKVRLFKITGFNGGMPTYDTTPIKLFTWGETDEELNNVSITLTKTIGSKEIKADDKVRTINRTTGATGTLNVINIDKEGYKEVFGAKEDTASGLLVNAENVASIHFGMFFETETYQKYIYNVVLSQADEPNETDDGTSVQNIAINLNIEMVNDQDVSFLTGVCYKGSSGWQENEPTKMLVPSELGD